MKIIRPTTITDAMLVSSTVAENDHPAWDSATVYAIGDRVIVAAEHKIYEALTSNTNKPPATSPSDWLDLGATNRWRMFDEKVGTLTSATTSMSVTLKPGVANALALINVNAATVQVTMTDPSAGVVFDRTYKLYAPYGVTDWYQYFFDEVRRKNTLVVSGMPSYRNAEIAVTLSGTTGSTIELGALVVGKERVYADAANAGASVGIQDFSRKERDAFGNFQIVERSFAKRARWSLVLRNVDVDDFQLRLAELRARPAVYVGSGRLDAAVIYGFYRDFDVVIAYPNHSECSIELEGLV